MLQYLLVPVILLGYNGFGTSDLPNIVYSTQEECIKEGQRQKSKAKEFSSTIYYDYLCVGFDPALNYFNKPLVVLPNSK